MHGETTMTMTSAFRGTFRWMSPELLHSPDSDGGTPTFESDIYALAMVFYEVLWLAFWPNFLGDADGGLGTDLDQFKALL